MEKPRIPVQLIFSLHNWTPKRVKTWFADYGYELGSLKCNEYEITASLCERSDYVTTTTERVKFGILEGIEIVTAKARAGKLKMMKATGVQ